MKKLTLILVFLTSAWLFLLFAVMAYRFEGTLFPVTSRLEITNIQPYYGRVSWSLVSGKFKKLRNCAFKGIEWNFAVDGQLIGEVRVAAEFEDPVQIRSAGEHSFSRLAVKLPPDDVIKNSRVYVYHDCYNGYLWYTKTLFYDSHEARSDK